MQFCVQSSCGRGLHRSSGLQKAQAIRMTSKGVIAIPKSTNYYLASRLRPLNAIPFRNAGLFTKRSPPPCNVEDPSD